jgi:osmotically-inducible protein OsmY
MFDPYPDPEGSSLMSNEATVEGAIRESLDFDPRIPDPGAIAVAVMDGVATLRGTLGRFSQRRAAVSDARKVDGVYEVDDQLDVRLMIDERREDADIRGAALQVLMWDSEVPADLIDVKVKDGWLTLTGRVSYQFESDAAYKAVADLFGVIDLTNEIKVVNP